MQWGLTISVIMKKRVTKMANSEEQMHPLKKYSTTQLNSFRKVNSTESAND
jgi:hypothetical protein